ncbi:MAG: nucleotidyltransferase domain-containing protein [Candidatus Bathyarchaeia archaeon]
MNLDPRYADYVSLIVALLKEKLGEILVSVALFGSVARREAKEGSDVDLLIVLEGFKGSFGERFQVFQEIDGKLMESKPYRALRSQGFGTLISPIPLTKEEVGAHPPILLDILTDGIILYDKEGFLKASLEELQRRLKALGARKVLLPDGSWYWDLKPDYRLGEVVEI